MITEPRNIITDKNVAPDPARRRLLGVGTLAATGLLIAPGTAMAALIPTPRRKPDTSPTGREVSLFNTHTGERLRAEYRVGDRYLPDALQAINHILRDHYTDDIHEIAPGLIDLMWGIEQKLERPATFNIVSGYRSPKTNAYLARLSSAVAKNSYHMSGQAVDLRIPSVRLNYIRKAAIALHTGGVGYYPSNKFIHVDVGPVRYW
ncbi:MAG: DUF882 domain-containing protein [Pseudomonadota bacterium]|nr:DUF882 domain-containing protein [Pseudomonadota bacterium]